MSKSGNVALTLPDGSVRTYQGSVTGITLASDIGPGLAKAAVAIVVDDEQWDLAREITQDSNVSIITNRDEAALEIFRHDAAHILAEAVQELFPDVQVTIGPAIDNGFYYDFAREEPFHLDDLAIIEKRMVEIIERNEEIVRSEMDRDAAITFFKDMGEDYKAELITAIPQGQTITLYKQGNFIDLCRGPHLPSTGKLPKDAFKLMKLAGAYWRGDSNNEMLQRIYGTAWRTKKELKAYLLRLEEAEKRDHRKIGREMNLFHFQEEAAGMPFWHPHGWTIYQQVEAYIRRKQIAYDYKEIKTPQLLDRKLWEASGHWEKFREHMYTTEADGRALAFKPMNCPCHVQVFNKGTVSYRDLPLRLAEFGACHRYEPSGALHGLMRVRSFVQDDAHIFCRKDQITAETITFCKMLKEVYQDFGFTDLKIKFSDRPDKRSGTDQTWDEAEKCLLDALNETGLEYTLNPGEGAFYGPKLEFVLTDAIGRDWQCGTLQVDFVLPERLNAKFIGEDNTKHTAVMLHRAILGSFERFIGILIEEHAGRFPMWLAPTQVVVTGITSDQDDHVRKVHAQLKAAGLRAEMDLRNEKINYKVREHSLAKTPAIFVVGGREAEENTVTIRRLGSKQQKTIALAEAIANLKAESLAPDLRPNDTETQIF